MRKKDELLRDLTEKILARHGRDPGQAATVGTPDSFSGEAVKIFVVRKAGASLTAEELLDYCKQNLVKYEWPKHIAFLDALPRTGVGKIDKRALKATAE